MSGCVSSSVPHVFHCHTTWGHWAVELLPHRPGAVGTRTPAIHRLTALVKRPCKRRCERRTADNERGSFTGFPGPLPIPSTPAASDAAAVGCLQECVRTDYRCALPRTAGDKRRLDRAMRHWRAWRRGGHTRCRSTQRQNPEGHRARHETKRLVRPQNMEGKNSPRAGRLPKCQGWGNSAVCRNLLGVR